MPLDPSKLVELVHQPRSSQRRHLTLLADRLNKAEAELDRVKEALGEAAGALQWIAQYPPGSYPPPGTSVAEQARFACEKAHVALGPTQPSECPTCGSATRAIRGWVPREDAVGERYACPDPFHSPQPPEERNG